MTRGAKRNWRAELTPWERVQVDCLLIARRAIGDRRDPASKLFTSRLDAIRNRARSRMRSTQIARLRARRARIIDGVHARYAPPKPSVNGGILK